MRSTKQKNLFKETDTLDATRQLMDAILNEGQKTLDEAQLPLDSKYKDFLLE